MKQTPRLLLLRVSLGQPCWETARKTDLLNTQLPRDALILPLPTYPTKLLVHVGMCVSACMCVHLCVPTQSRIQIVRSKFIHHSPKLGTAQTPVTVSGERVAY